MGECKFNVNDVGQCHVIKELIKRVKSGDAMRGKPGDFIQVVQISGLILLYESVPDSHHKFVCSICTTNCCYIMW